MKNKIKKQSTQIFRRCSSGYNACCNNNSVTWSRGNTNAQKSYDASAIISEGMENLVDVCTIQRWLGLVVA